MVFCCLRRNIEAFCHKHFFFVSRINKLHHLLPETSVTNLSSSGGTVSITPRGRSVDTVSITPRGRSVGSTQWSQILAEIRNFYLPHLHLLWSLLEYCHNVWYWKTRMVWIPDGEKSLRICLFVLTSNNSKMVNVELYLQWQTDRQLYMICNMVPFSITLNDR